MADNTPKCPHCGSRNTKKSTSFKIKKGLGYAAEFGIGYLAGRLLGTETATELVQDVSFADKVDDEWECNQCGYVWNKQGKVCNNSQNFTRANNTKPKQIQPQQSKPNFSSIDIPKLNYSKPQLMRIFGDCLRIGSVSPQSSLSNIKQLHANLKKWYNINIPISVLQTFASFDQLANFILSYSVSNSSGKVSQTPENNVTSIHEIEVVCGDGSKIEVSVSEDPKGLRNKPFSMTIVDAFRIEGRGTEVVGKIDAGYITLGDKIYINNNPHAELVVVGIEIYQRLVCYAEFDDNVGLLVQNEPQCKVGDVLTKEITGQYQPTTSNTTSISNSEQEYLEELKECLADGELGSSERRLLNKLRDKLGISEERANELEASLSKPQLSEEEKEYVEAYQDALEDGVVSEKERRLLDKLMKINDISEERAKELEKL